MAFGSVDFPSSPSDWFSLQGARAVTAGMKRSAGASRIPRDLLDYALFLPCIWLLSALGVYLKLGGSASVLGVLALFFGYAALRREPPPLWLTVYLAVCILAGVASHYRLFPNSWQVHFRHEAIVRQLAPVVSFFGAVWASKAYFRRRLAAGDAFTSGLPILFLALAVAPVIMFQQGFQYEGDDTLTSTLTMFGSFTNNMLIALFFLMAGAYCTRGLRRWICLAILFAILPLTGLAQYWVMMCGAVAVLVGAPARLTIAAMLLSLIALYGVGAVYIDPLMIEAPNSGIRIVFIMDALRSLWDTSGFGIGYGMESVRWHYFFPGRPLFTFLPEPSSITPEQMLEVLSTGVHNSFVQALLRTGVIGFVVLLFAFLMAFPRADLPRKLRNHGAVMFGIIFIACFVNPALESPIQGIGVGFVFGYLVALRSYRPAGAARPV